VIKLIYSLRHELGKFFSVGALAYVVGVGGFNLLVHLESAPLASKPLTASIISGILSIFVAYLGNRHWTWRDRARSGARREMSLFFIINGIALIFNVICLAISR
jgi:putative flippase GtrA